jgi:hypothetical protein
VAMILNPAPQGLRRTIYVMSVINPLSHVYAHRRWLEMSYAIYFVFSGKKQGAYMINSPVSA